MKIIKMIVFIITVLSMISVNILPLSAEAAEVFSYEKYFAKEREFKDESIGYTHDYYIYYCNTWLYRQDARTWKTKVLLKEKTTYVYPFRNIVYCVINDSQIITIDCNGNNKKLIYDAKIPIDVFFGNESIFFFSSGNDIYRYHLQSDTLELILSEEHFFFEPLSNDRLLLHKNILSNADEEYTDSSITYEYVISKKQKTEYIYPDYEVGGNEEIQRVSNLFSKNGWAILINETSHGIPSKNHCFHRFHAIV